MKTYRQFLLSCNAWTRREKANQEAQARKLDGFVLHVVLYGLAFLAADSRNDA